MIKVNNKDKPNPVNIYLFKLKNIIKPLEKSVKYVRRQRRRPGVFIVNFENTSHRFIQFQLLTLSK